MLIRILTCILGTICLILIMLIAVFILIVVILGIYSIVIIIKDSLSTKQEEKDEKEN